MIIVKPAAAPDDLWYRFLAKVRFPVTADERAAGCWLWSGATSKGRRGRRTGHMRIAGKNIKVHRLVLTWTKGDPPPEKPEGGHRCPKGTNSLCVHPEHLHWVSRVENEADKRVLRGN